jgi:hypothetical protein
MGEGEIVTRVTERDITLALKEKHYKDIFAQQVKMGMAGSKIMDAVAIKPTWSPITLIGYEIKTSRADFLNDQKYPHYMKTCTLFSFVAPRGVVQKDEIPKDAGLIEYNPETHKLRTVKKAPYNKVEIMIEVLLHIMFWKFDDYNRPPTKEEMRRRAEENIICGRYGKVLSRDIARKMESLELYKARNESQDSRWRDFQDAFQKEMGYGCYSPERAIKDLRDENRASRDKETSAKLRQAHDLIREVIGR